MFSQVSCLARAPAPASLRASRLIQARISPPSAQQCSQRKRFKLSSRRADSFASRWRRQFSRVTGPPPIARARNPLNYIEGEAIRQHNNRYRMRRMLIAAVGLSFSLGCLSLLVPKLKSRMMESQRVHRLDTQPGTDAASMEGKDVVVVSTKPGQPEIKLDAEGNELVETGTSTIPHFPRTISLPTTTSEVLPGAAPGENEGYSLLGLGIRTVSFLSIQVYVLGFYVRTTDLARLQAAFVKHINPIGSSLITGEKAELRKQLLEGETSGDLWDKILRETGVKSVVRITPTRNTDFSHLRDGWVRGITSRTQEAARRNEGAQFDDEAFGESMKKFKALFGGRGKAPKGSEVLLMRDSRGRLSVAYGQSENKPSEGEMKGKEQMGGIEDERISRLVWLGYLGGKNVSSESAQKNIVNGVMELVERPVGTVGVAVT
ncbi:MAG: Altered inheritance of mitochondria protein 18 mitochondrial [Chrysothrix sp. TS-e1954]|nr:MAG: Altered inheritance of mitochondria protein 18 mitochondrial [Chrysothrix sp. TS-e1954]